MSSPTPKQVKPAEVNFYEALKQVKAGRRITKLEWGNEAIYGALQDGRLRLHKTDNLFYDWIVSEADFEGNDYVIL